MSIGLDQSLLQAALLGFEAQLARLEGQIAQVKAKLPGGNRFGSDGNFDPDPVAGKRRKRRKVSEEGRKRMAEAQRRRWAAAREKWG
ncbi:MAG: hypothetical protein HYX27_17540 [Acidobacteria bacterium]|nr:hypothetical protein [Acidobacteriota bacterium]